MSYIVPRDATTIRPPLRIVDAAGSPLTGLSHDAAGLVIEYRVLPVTAWTADTQTAGGWTELGEGRYLPTIALAAPGADVEVRWRTAAVTAAPGLVQFIALSPSDVNLRITAATGPGIL